MKAEDIEGLAKALSVRTYLATVAEDGAPHVVPVHPAWEGNTIWTMTFSESAKVGNIKHQPAVAMHWEVDETGDGLLVWGDATLHDDLETKQRLWDGVFDYDLNLFVPDGPESDGVTFIAVEPTRATVIRGYGAGEMDRWSA